MSYADFSLIIPEMFVLSMACLVLFVDAFINDSSW